MLINEDLLIYTLCQWFVSFDFLEISAITRWSGVAVNMLCPINKVHQCRAWVELGWVTG